VINLMALVPINIKPSGSTITKTKKHNMEIHKLITCGNTSGGSRAVAKENDLGNGTWG
jgi:hypothetical protein